VRNNYLVSQPPGLRAAAAARSTIRLRHGSVRFICGTPPPTRLEQGLAASSAAGLILFFRFDANGGLFETLLD